MANIIVKDVAGLTVALKGAQAGDTIKLAAGDYASFTLSGVKFAGVGVTVTSLDPSHMATLNGFQLKGCEGIKFSQLEMVVDPAKINAYQILNSSSIAIDKADVHGSLDGDAQNDASAVLIRNSEKVTITNSEFHELKNGVGHLDSKNVVIDSNKFYDIQSDGVLGGGTSQITVSNNVFRDFYPKEKDHPDAIQFWTANTTASATDITVTGNVILRGEGQGTQGIFFRDQVETLPFKNVVISDNIVIGGAVNGIRVNGAENLTIEDNIVAGLPDQRSAITIDMAKNVTLTNNKATQFIREDVTGVTDTGSVVIAIPTDGGKALLESYLGEHTLLAPSSFYMDATTAALSTMEVLRQDLLTLTGTDGADRLNVDAKRDTIITSGAGNDLLTGGGIGHNTLVGGAGDDSYRVYSAFDVVVEDANGGVDSVSTSVDYELPANIEVLRLVGEAREGVGNELNNDVSGSTGDNVLYGMGGDDIIQAAGGDDYASGGAGNDTVNGNTGNDSVLGQAGNDVVRGNEGADSVAGGDGNDTVIGGEGVDVVSGGVGADLFQFGASDLASGEVILDFSRLEGDKIYLQPVDANVNLAGNQAFSLIGTGAFTKTAGQLRYEVSGSDSYLMGDTNGDGMADFKILMKGMTSFQSSDFFL